MRLDICVAVIFLCFICFGTGLVEAKTYSWTDANGNKHYVESSSEVPPQYRDKKTDKQRHPKIQSRLDACEKANKYILDSLDMLIANA